MASALVDVVVEKIAQLVTEEASLFLNFNKDFEWLSDKLNDLKGYLSFTDAHSARNDAVKRWMLKFENIAWDVEDILDEYATWDAENVDQFSCVCHSISCQLVFRFKMAHRIKDVKDRMRSIMENAAELKLVGDLTHPGQASRSTSQNVKWRGLNIIESGSRPVAIESKVEDVLRLLDDPAAPVIAVVGMGGVGKTFLLQNVFNSVKDKKNKFGKSIWLSISQTYLLKKLQAALAFEIGLDVDVIDSVDEVKAAELIHDRLESTRFLIVLGDVWRATGEYKLFSALGLPTEHNSQCKIVVTTRSRDVCKSMNAHVYELQPLSEEESWSLFCAFAFQGSQPPGYLKDIAREIEGKCAKLPLAVRTVAASLAE
ncbi:hypothetical protein SUGI_0367060 [Cryptomeria japonica]|uniref:putative disease resistance protein RGA3 n=1 Tax=Cryptomeria japonica TaxID=3369 RepID=UPI002408D27A|nr:putative disease resistance protein RGA3 [Cryptomeria japonica]GLJ20226.1 hypothetical protein SUGI_0367060 [Cryptomeria japonica]